MNYRQKYIKYKTKYSNLKSSKMNIQHGGIPINDARRKFPNNEEFYLFSYGSNGIHQLYERLSDFSSSSPTPVSSRVTEDDIKHNSYAAKLDGYRRGFFSYSKKWGGSTATIYEAGQGAGVDATSAVYGIVLKMSKKETERNRYNFFVGDKRVTFDNLLKSEGIDTNKYKIKQLDGVQYLRGHAYHRADKKVYTFEGNLEYMPTDHSLVRHQGSQPSISYMGAIADNMIDRRTLDRRTPNISSKIDIDIKIWDGGHWNDGHPKKITFTFE
jgi:hypothetical protein